jgi:uncharacterized protein
MDPNSNRPFPPPDRPWAISVRWEDLLFMHWPIPLAKMREIVPAGLQVETYDGSAWIGVVPFRMRNTRHRLLPPLPDVSTFPELNVRTYVRAGGRPGVYFFSLDAASKLAVRLARWTFNLQYFDARMRCETAGANIAYESHRIHRDAAPAEFRAQYGANGKPFPAGRGSLENFLTDRYCLYAVDRRGKVWRGDIHHAPWSLQLAEAEIATNTMLEQLRMKPPDLHPLLHFAKEMDVVAWLPAAV